MALLTDIRSYSDSTVARLVFAAVVIVFVFWGVGTAGMGPQAQTLAHVNGKRIIDSDLQRLMRMYTRQNQSSMNEAELKQLQSDVLDELILQEAMLQEAERLEIEVSDKEISFQVLQIDAFKGADGKFNEELYERVLKSDGLSQANFEEQLRQDLTLNKLRGLITGSIDLPEAIAQSRFNEIATEVKVRYATISSQNFIDDVIVEESDITTEIQENEADISTQYDDDLTRLYQLPERFQVERIIKNIGEESDTEAIRAELEGIIQKVADGEDFSQLALTASESPQPLTPLNTTQLGEEIAVALNSIQDGEITGIIETSAGMQLIKRIERLESTNISLEDAQRDIAIARVKEKKSPDLAKSFADDIFREWTETQSPPALSLLKKNILIETPAGFPRANSAIPGLSGVPSFESELQSISESGLLDQVFEANEAWFIVEVLELTPPSEEDFDTIGRYYSSQIKQSQKQEVLDAWTTSLLSRTKVARLFDPMNQ